MAKLNITSVCNVTEGAERSVMIVAVDELRGPVEIRMSEEEARWIAASLSPMYKRWIQEDGDTVD